MLSWCPGICNCKCASKPVCECNKLKCVVEGDRKTEKDGVFGPITSTCGCKPLSAGGKKTKVGECPGTPVTVIVETGRKDPATNKTVWTKKSETNYIPADEMEKPYGSVLVGVPNGTVDVLKYFLKGTLEGRQYPGGHPWAGFYSYPCSCNCAAKPAKAERRLRIDPRTQLTRRRRSPWRWGSRRNRSRSRGRALLSENEVADQISSVGDKAKVPSVIMKAFPGYTYSAEDITERKHNAEKAPKNLAPHPKP